jgi:hypothetical protein
LKQVRLSPDYFFFAAGFFAAAAGFFAAGFFVAAIKAS